MYTNTIQQRRAIIHTTKVHTTAAGSYQLYGISVVCHIPSSDGILAKAACCKGHAPQPPCPAHIVT